MRTTRQQSRGLRLKLVSAAVMSCFASAALANPTGPSAPPGINITGVGTSTVTVTNETSANAIINWHGFSIGVGELTQFQQFVNLAVLNRVTGTDISNILGTLRSDGRLFLINPNGIVVGSGAVLDLPGFVASSLKLTDDDFLAGRMNFQAVPGAGTVENYANISMPAGGSVYLVGPAVTNGGLITTPQGEVVLAAGSSVELMDAGTPNLSVTMTAPANEARNVGEIVADMGHVGIFGQLVTQEGIVSANAAVTGPGGSIRLVATDATTLAAGSSTTGGTLDIDTGSLTVAGGVNTGPQSIRAVGGVAVQNGQLVASGGQAIEAQYVEVETIAGAPVGAPVGILNFGGEQRISTTGANAAGEGLAVRNAGGGFLIIQNSGGTQYIDVAEGLTLQGGLGNALIAANGGQVVGGGSILLQGGSFGSGRSALITANSGPQWIEAGAGGITLMGGASGANNFAMINQLSTDPAATQAVRSAGPVLLEGGSGNFNFAMIRAFGGHQGFEAGATTLLAGAGGIDNFSSIQGRSQDMTVHGDLAIIARGSAGTPTVGGGARIGGTAGASPSATSLRLNVDGDFTMTAGSLAGTGVLLGNTTTISGNTDIDVNVGGDIALNGGSVPGAFAAIGSRAGNLAGGNIALQAGGGIALNSTSPDMASIIRTADIVSLTSQRITQGPDSRIESGTLLVLTAEGASLAGRNAVDMLSANNWLSGNLAFHNASPVLTVASAINPFGELSLRQAGDLRVIGDVSSGPQTIDVTGGLIVQNDPGLFAQLDATNGQTITASYVEVNGMAGGGASIFNLGGEQRISTSSANAAGEGLAVRATNGGFAVIDSQMGPQTLEVREADRMVVDAASGSARINSLGGPQTIALTGAGQNALQVGSPGATFQSFIGASEQTITAGAAGEQGSITLVGTAAFGTAQILAGAVPGGTQTVSTSGALRVLGGSAPGNSTTGIFANGIDGLQTIRAESILLQGGTTGNGNAAMIGANSGSQLVEVGAGGITLIGGEAGTNNFVQIGQQAPNPAYTQTVTSVGPVHLQGGDTGTFNFAMIRGFGGAQHYEAGTTTLLAGDDGTNNFAAILSPHQELAVHGDLNLIARGSGGTPTVGGGTRIGGLGGAAPSVTDLVLAVDGNVTLTGGSVEGTGSAIGGNAESSLRVGISLQAGGDVTLNPGAASGSRIGSSAANVADGEILVEAGGTLALNSASLGNAGAIRTNDGVTLRANRVTQGTHAQIQAGTLRVETSQGASLGGANLVDAFRLQNASWGNVDLNNASPLLTVTGIDQVSDGALNVSQSGDLLIAGDVQSGAQAISATGDMTIAAGDGPGVTVYAAGPQTFNVGGSFSLLGGTALGDYAQTLASGPVQVTTGGNLTLQGGSGLLAYALLYGGDSVRLTVGDELHVEGGSGLFAFARVQTDFWEKIFLSFPNRSNGGYFVNGREGATHDGLDGFFTGLLPARRGRGLVVSYGE